MSKEAVKELIKLIKSGEVKFEDITKETLDQAGIQTTSNGEVRRLLSDLRSISENKQNKNTI